MKTMKSMTVTVLACASLIFTACAKKDDNNGVLTAGTLQSDGQKITSTNSNISGQPLTLTLSNIVNNGTTGNYNSSGYNQGSVGFDLALNGATTRVVSPLMTGPNQFSNTQYVGQFSVDTGSICFDAACNEIIVDLAIGSQGNYQSNTQTMMCKEIIFKKNIRDNRITALKELNVSCNALKTFNDLRTAL